LKEGMAAYFTVDAYPGKRFKGTIAQIRNAATNVQNVVTYDAVIKVDNDQLELRPGMTANVTITYAERDNVLAVPNAALRFHPPDWTPPNAGGGKGQHKRSQDEPKPVFIVKNEKAEPVMVHTGLSDGAVTELVDGDLHEGDAIAIDTQDGSAQGASSAKTSSPFGGGGGGGGGGGRRMF